MSQIYSYKFFIIVLDFVYGSGAHSLSSWIDAQSCSRAVLSQSSHSPTPAEIEGFMSDLNLTTTWINMRYTSHLEWNNGTKYDASARPLAVHIGNCGAVQGGKYQTLLCSYKRGYTCRGKARHECFKTEVSWDEAYEKCQIHGKEMGDNTEDCQKSYDGYWVGFKRKIKYKNSNKSKLLKLPRGFRATSCSQAHTEEGCGILHLSDNQLRCKFVSCDERHPSVCIAKLECPDPPQIINGDVRVVRAENWDHLVAYYNCTSGYISVNQEMWCNGTGRWLGIKPRCVGFSENNRRIKRFMNKMPMILTFALGFLVTVVVIIFVAVMCWYRQKRGVGHQPSERADEAGGSNCERDCEYEGLHYNRASQNQEPEQSREHEYEGLDYTASQVEVYEQYEIPIPDFIVKKKGRWENSTSLPDMRDKMKVIEDYNEMIKMKTI